MRAALCSASLPADAHSPSTVSLRALDASAKAFFSAAANCSNSFISASAKVWSRIRAASTISLDKAASVSAVTRNRRSFSTSAVCASVSQLLRSSISFALAIVSASCCAATRRTRLACSCARRVAASSSCVCHSAARRFSSALSMPSADATSRFTRSSAATCARSSSSAHKRCCAWNSSVRSCSSSPARFMSLACDSRLSSTSFFSFKSSAFHSLFFRSSAEAYADSIASTCFKRSKRSHSSHFFCWNRMSLSRPSTSFRRASSISAMRCASASQAISMACSSPVRF
mmetsp:Transcript_11842/g.39362  ORF Transcript_11842/g.39362 Transcript_11842/m.39362 type:complete len:287 (+) Transcript_11842:1362-2222(+)